MGEKDDKEKNGEQNQQEVQNQQKVQNPQNVVEQNQQEVQNQQNVAEQNLQGVQNQNNINNVNNNDNNVVNNDIGNNSNNSGVGGSAEQEDPVGLKAFEKTFTGMYKKTSVEDILDAGWILNGLGEPVEKSGDPDKDMQLLYEMVKNQDPDSKLYFTNVQSQWEGVPDDTVTLDVSDKGFAMKSAERHFVDIKKKNAVLDRLGNINEKLQKYNVKNADMQILKDTCDDLMTALENTKDASTFNIMLDKFAETAEEYYIKHAPASLNKRQVKNLSIAYDILKLKDDVLAGRVPKEPDKVEELQTRVAAKFVSGVYTYQSKKGKTDTIKSDAADVLFDPSKFMEKVNQTLKDSSFQYLYGSRETGDMQDVLSRLAEGISSKAAKVLKNVVADKKNPARPLEMNELLKEDPPKRVNERKQYESMSLQDQKPITEMVKSLREELDAIGGSNTSSPEFEKLRHELLVADIRLQRESAFMDVKMQMAELGDAVDEYVSKKLQEGKLKGRSAQRLNVAMRLRDLCDGVAKDKKPDAAVKSKDETAKAILAERITKYLAKTMMNSQDSLTGKKGAFLFKNQSALKKAANKLINSDSFKSLFSDSSKVEAALATKPENLYNQILKEEFKKAAPDDIQKAKAEKIKEDVQTKNKSSVKSDLEKDKELANELETKLTM